MNLVHITDTRPIHDRFQQQAAEIATILADPDVRLADDAQYYRFGELARAAIGNLREPVGISAVGWF